MGSLFNFVLVSQHPLDQTKFCGIYNKVVEQYALD